MDQRENDGKKDSRRHLDTDHLLDNLNNRTVTSGLITATAQGAKFILTIGSTIVLARLLTPSDFGLIAMVATLLGFLRVFKDAGLSIATIQKENINQQQVSNLFWINLLVGITATLIVLGMSYPIAWFYEDERLISISIFLSVSFLFSSASVQHIALLNRTMRFKAIAVAEITAMVVSVTSGIVAAYHGYGYWALVIAPLVLEFTQSLLSMFLSGWVPSLPKSRCGTRSLVNFGVKLSISSMLYSIARGLDNVLIGRFYGADATGLYSRASALILRPLEQFLSPINRVIVPALSRLQNNPKRYRVTFLKMYSLIAMIAMPLTAMLLALSEPITLVLLGNKWSAASAIFAGFTLAALYIPLASASTWLFTTQGRGTDLLKANSMVSVLIVFSFIAGIPFGPTGVAISFSVTGLLIRLPILYYFAGKSGPIKSSDLWKGLLKYTPLWIVIFMVTYITIIYFKDYSPLLRVLIGGSTGLVFTSTLFVAISPLRNSVLSLRSALRS